jgi:hypothetical protein
MVAANLRVALLGMRGRRQRMRADRTVQARELGGQRLASQR